MFPSTAAAAAAPASGFARLPFSTLTLGTNGGRFDLREDHVAFGLVVEEPDTAADDPVVAHACRRR